MSKTPPKPPGWPGRMLSWFCAEEHVDILKGDLEELFELRVEEKGAMQARLHYVKDAFDMLRPFARKKKNSKLKNNTIAMFKNYFKISFRNMLRHKVYSSINIAGLSIGIACFLLIFSYVQDELSYDRYHEHSNEIYRVVVERYNSDGEVARVFGYASPMHGKVLREDYPQVVTSVRFDQWNFPIIRYEEKQFNETFFNFVEPTIFDVFSFKFIEGSAENALTEPNTVVLTASTAEKYFGSEKAVGKVIKYDDGRMKKDFQVIGVIEDFPENSHMSYNFLASWSTVDNGENPRAFNDYYGNYNYATYIRVEKNSQIEDLKAQMPAMLDKYVDNIDSFTPSTVVGLAFQKLTDIHLNSSAGAGGTSNAYYVKLFAIIGVMVLLIACINYMNLATAKYATRLKEVGVRKVMGAGRHNISGQFLTESSFYAGIALLLGYGIALLALPSVNSFSSKSLTLNPLENTSLILSIVGLMAFVGLLAGSYPATFMSRLNVIGALKGGKSGGRQRSWFRSGLVVFQFSITTALILGVVVVERQLHFIHTKDPGFDRELLVNYWASPAMNERLELAKNELLANPNIVQVSASSRIPTSRLGDALGTKTFKQETGEVVDFRLPFIRVDKDFLDVYDIDLVAGQGFTGPLADSTQRFLINEMAVKRLGWQNPEEAIGQRIEYGWYDGFVMGVVSDFHFESMHSAIQPMIMMNDNRGKRQLTVKISGTDIQDTFDFMEGHFKRYNPDRNFNPTFVDEMFDSQYKGEQKLSQISKTFSLIAVAIACMGLLGLVSYSMEQRAKEMSVRKVLGASVRSMLFMINKEYAGIMAVAFVIAIPLALYFLNDWLGSFAYHIDIGVGLVLVASILALVIALFTICIQVLRTATTNPVNVLRNE